MSLAGPKTSETDRKDAAILARLNAVRLIVVLFIALGYSSTMAVGPQSREWLNTFGYDPSLFGLQVLFFLSGWLAWRSLARGRTIRQFIASRVQRVLPWLALYTFIVVTLLYPALCNHDAAVTKTVAGLVRYFLETVTLINPGQVMPGALDGALYACLLQGAVWSFQWGVIAYAALLFAYGFGARNRIWFLGLLAAAICAHIGVNWWTDQTGSALFAKLIPGLRLAVPFLMGICAYGWKDRLPDQGRGWAIISAAVLGVAIIHYYAMPWSYAIELLAMTGWCGLAKALLHSRITALKNWPHLDLPLFLGIWPITQLVLVIIPGISVPALVTISLCLSLATAMVFVALKRLAGRPLHRRVQTA